MNSILCMGHIINQSLFFACVRTCILSVHVCVVCVIQLMCMSFMFLYCDS